MVKSLPVLFIEGGRSSSTTFFQDYGSLDDCDNMNCMDCYFPIVYDHNRFYSGSMFDE